MKTTLGMFRRIGQLRLVRRWRTKLSLIRDILDRPFYELDTSQDPFNLNFVWFINEVKKRQHCRILELGAKDVSKRGIFRGCDEYVGFDIHPGNEVDVVGDCHYLSSHFPASHFDVVISVAVFEHLAMPWKVILEINKVMKRDGLLYIVTHPTWPPHKLPWDFWRYSKEAFKVLLNPATGFELLRAEEGLPCSLFPLGYEASMIGMHKRYANLGVSVVAKKTGEFDQRLAWDFDITAHLNSIYPS